VFSDESYKVLVKPSDNIEHSSVISYSISFSNLTWGEDMSRHINTHIDTALKDGIFTNVLLYISSHASRIYSIAIFPIAFLVALFVMNRNIVDNEEKMIEATKHNIDKFNSLLDENTIESISKKLNIIMSQVGYKEFTLVGFWWLGLILILGTIINGEDGPTHCIPYPHK
jgi:hypothetical protein